MMMIDPIAILARTTSKSLEYVYFREYCAIMVRRLWCAAQSLAGRSYPPLVGGPLSFDPIKTALLFTNLGRLVLI